MTTQSTDPRETTDDLVAPPKGPGVVRFTDVLTLGDGGPEVDVDVRCVVRAERAGGFEEGTTWELVAEDFTARIDGDPPTYLPSNVVEEAAIKHGWGEKACEAVPDASGGTPGYFRHVNGSRWESIGTYKLPGRAAWFLVARPVTEAGIPKGGWRLAEFAGIESNVRWESEDTATTRRQKRAAGIMVDSLADRPDGRQASPIERALARLDLALWVNPWETEARSAIIEAKAAIEAVVASVVSPSAGDAMALALRRDRETTASAQAWSARAQRAEDVLRQMVDAVTDLVKRGPGYPSTLDADSIVSCAVDSIEILRTLTTAAAGDDVVSPGSAAIVRERRRQVTKEGWTAEHDDRHRHGEMAVAAACYAARAAACPRFGCPTVAAGPEGDDAWPWLDQWDKRAKEEASIDERIRMLEKSGALSAAEIDRLRRLDRAQRAAQETVVAVPADGTPHDPDDHGGTPHDD